MNGPLLLLLLPYLALTTAPATAPLAPLRVPPAATGPAVADTAIRAALAAQAAAWNRGDLAAYMAAGYWESDSLLFLGANGPTMGYAATLARYRQRYPSGGQMGQLTFTLLRVEILSPNSAFVAGRWELKRAHDAPAGAFTLLWRHKKGRWVIVADHSS